MRWFVIVHRWLGLAAAIFLTFAGVTGCILVFRSDSTTVLQLHVRLMAGAAGEWIVTTATVVLLLIVPTGLVLWWRAPRFAIRRGLSLRRSVYDLHTALGFYSAILVSLLAATGAFLGFEEPLSRMLGVREWRVPAAPHSIASSGKMQIDDFLTRARSAAVGATVTRVMLPKRRTSAVRIEMRGPGAFDRSTVYLDRYTGAVLRVDDLASTPLWYRFRAAALALHTGDVYGMAGRILGFLASLSLTLLIISGTWMWCARRW